MKRRFTIDIEEGEDGDLAANVKELQGCHTQAKTYDELLDRIKEAFMLCLK